MFGQRICARCSATYYYPDEGGTKYCKPCRRIAKTEYEKMRRQLGKQALDPIWKVRLNLPQERFAEELEWPWACSVCGMKYQSRAEAADCCRESSLRQPRPIYFEEGYQVWVGEMITRQEYEDEGIHPSTPSPLAITSQDWILAALAVGN